MKRLSKNLSREDRINNIIELYKDNVEEETVKKLANLFPLYGGTVIGKLVLDLYDSLVYDEKPQGPNGNQTL